VSLFLLVGARTSAATNAPIALSVLKSWVIDVPIAAANSSAGPHDPKMMREELLTGGCLCGAVRYEVRGPFLRVSHCHCSRCRRHSGTAMSTQGRVRREHFRLVSIRFGSLDGDPGIVPQFHTFVGSKTAWDEIRDDLPQYPGPVPPGLR
jgi:hypothetical protein